MGKADDVLNVSQGNNLTKMRMAGHNLNNNRQKDDFYPTPPEAIIPLLERENLKERFGNVLVEMVQYLNLKEHNYDVYSSDLVNRNYGEPNIDFLKSYRKTDNILTNPPFKLYRFCISFMLLVRKR